MVGTSLAEPAKYQVAIADNPRSQYGTVRRRREFEPRNVFHSATPFANEMMMADEVEIIAQRAAVGDHRAHQAGAHQGVEIVVNGGA